MIASSILVLNYRYVLRGKRAAASSARLAVATSGDFRVETSSSRDDNNQRLEQDTEYSDEDVR